jgi:5-hydroxyisourate hydrolase
MSKISTHVLDAALGKPASGMEITLLRLLHGQRSELALERTNVNGRIENLGSDKGTLENGTYCLHFSTEAYFKENRISVFYPYVEIVFTLEHNQPNYHIPLVLSPFGYSTYRGS